MGLIYDIFEQFSIEVFYSIVMSYIVILYCIFVSLTSIRYTKNIKIGIAIYGVFFVLHFIFL